MKGFHVFKNQIESIYNSRKVTHTKPIKNLPNDSELLKIVTNPKYKSFDDGTTQVIKTQKGNHPLFSSINTNLQKIHSYYFSQFIDGETVYLKEPHYLLDSGEVVLYRNATDSVRNYGIYKKAVTLKEENAELFLKIKQVEIIKLFDFEEKQAKEESGIYEEEDFEDNRFQYRNLFFGSWKNNYGWFENRWCFRYRFSVKQKNN